MPGTASELSFVTARGHCMLESISPIIFDDFLYNASRYATPDLLGEIFGLF